MPRIHASGNVSGVEPETPLGALRQLLIDQRADLEADGPAVVEAVEEAVVAKVTRKRKGGASSPATGTSSESTPKSSSSGTTNATGSRRRAPTTGSL